MSDLDVENICRLCCEKKGRLRSLFERKPANHSLSLQQMILDVTRLEVEPGDGMPQRICRVCASTLVKMHETIEGYRTNDLKLRQQLSALKPPQLIEIKEEEVEFEVLEDICKQDMIVNNICIKEEVDEEEYHDNEELDGVTEPALTDGVIVKKNESETDTADEAVKDDDEWMPDKNVQDAEDNEWNLDEEVEEKVIKRKSTSKGSGLRRKRNPDEPPKKYVRRHYRDPSAPRFSDFKCYICSGDSHGTAEALLAHLNSCHLDILPFTCTECVTETVVIRTVVAVNSHKRQHMNPEKCPHCDRRYSSKRGVDLHISMHHTGDNEPNPSPCDYCGKVCSSKVALKIHRRIHTSGSACEICGKVFLERSKLRRHIQNKHEKLKKYECHFCQKKLASMSAVQNHIDTFHSSLEFKCSYCPKTFSSKLTHRYHEKKHEDKNYVATKDWKEYYTILEGQEGKMNKQKKCKLCGIITVNMGAHLGNIHFPTVYQCEICDATFKGKTTYTAHVQEHEHGKAHQCPICEREFTERRNLISHLRTKKHRDHPLAQAMLGVSSTAKTEKSNWGTDDDDSQEDKYADFEFAPDKLM
ncbi:hypothetical protein RP20_CCG006555 [Aedes albopictus]|nr:hypothetical protein RP20_CCG006555 [Aedes albopictus]